MGSSAKQRFNPGTSGQLKAGGPQVDWTDQQRQAGGRMEAPVALPGQPMGIGRNFVTPPPLPQRMMLADVMRRRPFEPMIGGGGGRGASSGYGGGWSGGRAGSGGYSTGSATGGAGGGSSASMGGYGGRTGRAF